MLAWDIIKFLKQYGEPWISVGDPQDTYDFFFDIINSGQVVLIKDGKGLAAAALYYKVRGLEEIILKRSTFRRMRNFRAGPLVYVHTMVIRPDLRKTKLIWKLVKELRDREPLCDKVSFTFNKNEKWAYKIIRRRDKMRDNCGIIALDALLKSLNMNMNRISLDTLSKICRDNGRLMFPLKVPKKRLTSLQYPYILQSNNHYEVIEDDTALDGLDLGELAFVLYPTLNATTIPLVMDEEEAKQVKGAGGGGGIQGYFSKPGRLLPMAASALAPSLGIGPTMGNLIGTGIGALQGATSGLWGQPGGSSMLGGAAQGFGQSLLGRGIGGMLNPSSVGLQAGMTNQPWKGFQLGLEQSIPFKNAMFGGTNPITSSWINSSPVPPATSNNFMNNYYTHPPAGSAVAQLQQTMSPADYASVTGTTAPMTTQGYMSNYYANPPAGSAVANLKNSMSAEEWSKLAVPSAGAYDTAMMAGGGGGGGGGAGMLGNAANIASQSQVPAQQGGFLKNIAPSAALMLAGQAIQQPSYNVPSAADMYTQMINSGAIPQYSGPLGQAAQAATLKNINSPDTILETQIQPYKDAITADLNRREKEEIAFIRTVHSQNGTSGGSDEVRDIEKIQEKYRDYEIQQLGAIDQNLYNQKVTIYLDSISQAYGMDQANLQTIAGLTGASIQEAAIKYGLKAQQVQDFRNAINQLAISAAPGANQTTAASLLGKILQTK